MNQRINNSATIKMFFMDMSQGFRRIAQQMKGWDRVLGMQSHQLKLIKKLFERNGLKIELTCGACPEQYDVTRNGEASGYLRLRHGHFTVDYPDCMAQTIYEAFPNGDGCFDDDERLNYLTKAMRAILAKVNQ